MPEVVYKVMFAVYMASKTFLEVILYYYAENIYSKNRKRKKRLVFN